jgi:hypothetical protein
MAKPKGSPTNQQRLNPIRKRTRQGQGRGSKPNHGRKQTRGQG